mgnify:CR=1 FL=1
MQSFLEFLKENKSIDLNLLTEKELTNFQSLITESYTLTEEDELEIDKRVNLFMESFDKNEKSITFFNEELTNEGIIGSIIGGLTGFAAGKTLGKIVARVLGLEKGVLYDLLTSRLVGAALGSAVGKTI